MRTKKTVVAVSNPQARRGKRAHWQLEELEPRKHWGTWMTLFLDAQSQIGTEMGTPTNDYMFHANVLQESGPNSAYGDIQVGSFLTEAWAQGISRDGTYVTSSAMGNGAMESGNLGEIYTNGSTSGDWGAYSGHATLTMDGPAKAEVTAETWGSANAQAYAQEQNRGSISVSASSAQNYARVSAMYESGQDVSGPHSWVRAAVDGTGFAGMGEQSWVSAQGFVSSPRINISGWGSETVAVGEMAWTFNMVPGAYYEVNLTVSEDVNGDNVGDVALFQGSASSQYNYGTGRMQLSTWAGGAVTRSV